MFFVLGAKDAVDGIRRAAARIVVVADLHLAEQADGEQVQSAEQKAESSHHERTVVGHDVDVANELFRRQPGNDPTPPEDAEHAEAAKEMQRAREIAQQKTDGKEIKEDTERASEIVVRSTALAVHVADGHFADGCAIPRRQRGNKAMEFAVERNLLENVAAIGLEGCAEVVNVDARNFRHHPVGDARRQTTHPEVVDAYFAPATDDFISGGDFFQEERNVVGIVLQIAIHGDDVLAAGMIKSRGQAGGLAEVAAEFNDSHAAIDSCDFAQHGESVIAGAIVDENDFETFAVGLHDGLEAIVEVGDVFLLVM